jgi:hypothetical protein
MSVAVPREGPFDHLAESRTDRLVTLDAASTMRMRRVKWLEQDRVPAGAMTLLGGREGIGKSILAYTMAAQVTRGELPGIYLGQPMSVVVAATEDSWSMTIVPRLVAAGADLERIFRVNVTTPGGVDTSLSLPDDLVALEGLVDENGVAMVILDPLLSRLSSKLDTHVDAQVRLALEPLVALADRTGAAVVGLIHVNKVSTADPLTSLMGSRAFAAVARAVIYMMEDPDDRETRLVGVPKNNLGRSDLPTRSCRIDRCLVDTDDEGEEIWTGKLVWTGDRSESISDVLESSAETAEVRSATSEATDWLTDFLGSMGGSAPSAIVKEKGRTAGHSISALTRARVRAYVVVGSGGYPRATTWSLPKPKTPPPSPETRREIGTVHAYGVSTPETTETTELTEPTELTELTGAVVPVGSVGSVVRAPHARGRAQEIGENGSGPADVAADVAAIPTQALNPAEPRATGRSTAVGPTCPDCREGTLVVWPGQQGVLVCSRRPNCGYNAPGELAAVTGVDV